MGTFVEPESEAVVAANNIRQFTVPSVGEITASDPYRQKEKNAMKALINELEVGGETSWEGVRFKLSKSESEGFTKVEITSGGKKLELFVHNASGDIRRSESKIGEKSWEEFTGREGLLALHDEMKPAMEALRKRVEASRQQTATTQSQVVDTIPSAGKRSEAWEELARKVAVDGGKQNVGALTITSTTVPAASPTGGAQTAASYNVKVSMGTQTAKFSVGSDGKISGVTGEVGPINEAIRRGQNHVHSPGPGPSSNGVNSKPYSRETFDKDMKEIIGWAWNNRNRDESSMWGLVYKSSLEPTLFKSTIGTDGRIPSGACPGIVFYLQVKNSQGKLLELQYNLDKKVVAFMYNDGMGKPVGDATIDELRAVQSFLSGPGKRSKTSR